MIAAQIVNGSWMSNHWYSHWPIEAAPAERVEERDAADDRRKHERQDRERAHHAAAGEVAARDQPRDRESEEDRERGRRERAHERQTEGFARVGIAEHRADTTPRRAPQQTDQRQDEEDDETEDADDDGGEWRLVPDPLPPSCRRHRGRNPYVSTSSLECATTKSSQACASAAFFASFSFTMGSVVMTLTSSGISTPSTLPDDATSLT